MHIELSIVIPCLNEAESLPFCLEKAKRFLSENNVSGEIIVVRSEERRVGKECRL